MHAKISLAPMLDITDRHFRYFLRLISPHTLLYTEMVTTGAILFGDAKRYLDFDSFEHPVALQLAGSNPLDVAKCAKIANDYGYDEINLNCGCPSQRVQNGSFGACLMLNPENVANITKATLDTLGTNKFSIKMRLGVDDKTSYGDVVNFINVNHQAGCNKFIIHARCAHLKKLSPKENRKIPELKYDMVYQIKKDFPELEIVINGGFKTLDAIKSSLNFVDGVMIGVAAYQNPYLFAEIEQQILGQNLLLTRELTREQVWQSFLLYCQKMAEKDIYPKHMVKAGLGLYYATPTAKSWRHYISELMIQNKLQ